MDSPEGDLDSYLKTLPKRYQAFFNTLLLDYIDPKTLFAYGDFIRAPDVAEATIADMVNQLQPFARTPETARHEDVREGWSILRSFFEPKRNMLRRHGVVPVVFGSLRYDDPHNLDYDVALFGNRYHDLIEALSSGDWHDELNAIWLTENEGAITYVTTQKTSELVTLMSRDANARQIEDIATFAEADMGVLGAVFNGSPLFPDDATHIPLLANQFAALIRQEPLIAAIVAVDLKDTLNTRLERRQAR